MTTRDESHPIDQLVLQHLESRAARLSTEALATRVGKSSNLTFATTDFPEPKRATWGLGKRTLAAAASIAVLVTAFNLGRWDTPVQAEPDGIVKAALSTHAAPVERCYVVTLSRQSPPASDTPAMRDVRIWTQGDRFWVDVNRGPRNWAWGRDESGDVWLTLGPRRAMRIEANEVGAPLNSLCDLYSLQWESLLQTTLDQFQLERVNETETTYVISAQPPSRGRGRTRELVVEFDKESRAVRRLEVKRLLDGQLQSQIEFTLVDSRTPDESLYQPEGHLTVPYSVFTRRGTDDRRSRILTAWFGANGSRWIRPLPDLSDNSTP